MTETKGFLTVPVQVNLPVAQAISNMLYFDRSDPNEVVSIGPTGEETRLQFYEKSTFPRIDVGLINMKEGVEPRQLCIEPYTRCPVVAETWQQRAIQIWFERYGEQFREQLERLRELCGKYEAYEKHFGPYVRLK